MLPQRNGVFLPSLFVELRLRHDYWKLCNAFQKDLFEEGEEIIFSSKVLDFTNN